MSQRDNSDTLMAYRLGIAFAHLRVSHNRSFSDRQKADISDLDKGEHNGRCQAYEHTMRLIERVVRGEDPV